MLTFKQRESRYQWLVNNSDKKRSADKRWRKNTDQQKLRDQARKRMQRFRAAKGHLRVTGNLDGAVVMVPTNSSRNQ